MKKKFYIDFGTQKQGSEIASLPFSGRSGGCEGTISVSLLLKVVATAAEIFSETLTYRTMETNKTTSVAIAASQKLLSTDNDASATIQGSFKNLNSGGADASC